MEPEKDDIYIGVGKSYKDDSVTNNDNQESDNNKHRSNGKPKQGPKTIIIRTRDMGWPMS